MKIRLLIALLFASYSVFGQSQPTAVDGIGKFKIGKTTIAVIPEIEKELGEKSKQLFTYLDTSKNEGKRGVFELVADTVNQFGGPVYASQVPGVKVYWLPEYAVAEIPLHGVRLKFYHDVLVDFQCDNPTELRQALTIKYGEPRAKLEEREVACTLKLTGQGIKRTGQTATYSWGTESVPANCVISKYYDSHCQEKLLSFFSVYDNATAKKLYSTEEVVRLRRENARNTEKKKKLGDL